MGLMNIFKKRKPWVRFYSIDPGVADLHPWFPARKLHRKWRTDALKAQNAPEKRCPYKKVESMWKRMSAEMMGEQAMPEIYTHGVTCPALASVMDSGYILPAPADILIKTDGSGVNFEWLSPMLFHNNSQYVKAHIPQQTEGMRELVNQQEDVLDWTIKLELPWRVQSHPDILFLQQPIPYWDEDRFTPPTGIVDPSFSYDINLQLFWHKIEAGEYYIKAGTPLCQWIPLHRDFFKMKNWDIFIETANDHDIENNKIMDYQRGRIFIEGDDLKGRIKVQRQILGLNKNIKRFM